ncbi:MAG: dihydrodipicolinate synthase family protein [Eubacteriales bacterium]|nr:dihydrodipicolinate synthase family protein [Eubacteriales bacterium]
MRKLEGIIIPCITPFDEEGILRLDWLKSNFQKWNTTEISGYMVLGSNGEFRSLSDDEAFHVIQTVSALVPHEKTLIAGVGRESLYHTVRFIKRLEEEKVSVDYISVLTPCYFKKLMSDEALIDYYKRIADESPYPVLLYCAPGFANDLRISAKALEVLAEHPNIAGIKDTSADMMDTYMAAVGKREDFQVFAGSLNNILTCLKKGGKGGIISVANYFPRTCAEFYRIFREEGQAQGEAYLDKLKVLAKETGAKAGVAGVKALMNLMGYQAGVPRRPVLPCDDMFVRNTEHYIKENRAFILDQQDREGSNSE